VTDEEAPGDPRWITESMLLMIHARQIEKYGGAHGVLDENVVLSALARPRHLWAYSEGADLSDLAAAYLVGFTRSQGFQDGNKRTGLACALVFLALNGFELHVPPKELFALCLKVALGEGDDAMVSAYLRERITPRS